MKNKIKNKNRTHKSELLKAKSNNFNYLNLLKRYNTLPQRYNLYIINNIIFNINSRRVSHFKDFLIYDDPNDFFRRFYHKKESGLHLKYYISFYEENNKIFPNYYCLPESKYLYRNIQQKQNILNNIENRNFKYKSKGHSYSTIFSSSIKRSIYNESVYPSNSMNSTGDDDLKKLIKVINDNYSTISHICKKEKSLNTVSFNNLSQKNQINQEMEKLAINNNLSSCQKNSLISKKKEKSKIIDIKKNLKNKEINNNNNCLSDRDKNVKSKSKDTKDNKDARHKRVMTHYNKELMSVCGNLKNSLENGKNSTESKEKLKSLIKTIKYIIKKNNNNVHKNKNINHHNHTITEIDNINININTNNKISITSRNMDKNTNVNNRIIKSVINSIIHTRKNNSKNRNKKSLINQNENLRNYLRKKIKIEQGNNSYKVVCNKLCPIRNEYKTNKNLLNHIKTNSNLNSNLLTETISKINRTVLSNNNSVSFNSPFIRKKIVNKSTSTESFPKLQISNQKKHKKKILIKNNTKSRRKTLTDVCCIKENQDKSKTIFDNNYKKYNKYSELEHKKELYDFSTQINFRGHKQFINKYRNTSKNLLPNTIQKVRSYKKENRSTFLAKSNINKNININNTNSTIIKNSNCSKKFNLGLRSRNNTTLNSLNINLTGIKNLKMLNNLYTTVNIYGSSRYKNNIRSGLKTERTNCKLTNGTYFFDNKKLFKKLKASNVITYLNKKKQSNNNLSNNLIQKFHNKTNSSSINNTESTFSINKTSNNFNHIIKKNILHNNTYNYLTKIKKVRFKNVRPMLIKKYDKEIIYPQNSARIPFGNKNESSKIKTDEYGINLYRDIYLNTMESGIRVNSTIRKLSTDDKKPNIVSSYSASENNKKKQKKIKLKNFKQLIDHNINSDRKEIDRKILHDIFNEKKSHQKKFSSGNN